MIVSTVHRQSAAVVLCDQLAAFQLVLDGTCVLGAVVIVLNLLLQAGMLLLE